MKKVDVPGSFLNQDTTELKALHFTGYMNIINRQNYKDHKNWSFLSCNYQKVEDKLNLFYFISQNSLLFKKILRFVFVSETILPPPIKKTKGKPKENLNATNVLPRKR